MYLFKVIRQNPAMKTHALRRIFLMPLVSLGMLLYSEKIIKDYVTELSTKYLNGITDYEIVNFDALY